MTLIKIDSLELFELYKREFAELMDFFFKKAKSESNIERLLKYILVNLRNNNKNIRIYLVLDDKFEPVAYYILQVYISIDTFEYECFIYQVSSKIGIIKEIDDKLIDGLQKEGITKIEFRTKRNEEAFERHLDKRFIKTGTIYEMKMEG